MLLLTVLAVTAVTALVHPRKLVISAAHKQSAVLAAHEAMERSVAADYAELSVGVVEMDLGDHYRLQDQAVSVTREIVLKGGGTSPEYKAISISVAYTGEDVPLMLHTIVSEGGDS